MSISICLMCLEQLTNDEICDHCKNVIKKGGHDMDGDIIYANRKGRLTKMYVNELNGTVQVLDKGGDTV